MREVDSRRDRSASSLSKGTTELSSTPTTRLSRRRRYARLWIVVCAVSSVLAIAASAWADARSDYLVRVLRTSPMFRVRAQAAISLGGVQSEPEVVSALVGALSDAHPAVRGAAAAALQRQGDPSALPALRRAARDPEAAVRTAASQAVRHLTTVAQTGPRTQPLPPAGGGNARYYVAVGRPGTKVRSISPATLAAAQQAIERMAREVPGVEIAPSNQSASAATKVLRQRNLVGYFLDSSIVEIEQRPDGGTRARVSVVLQSYPDRNIRSMLSGAATVMGASGAAAQQQAIEGALRGALRNLPQAMQAGARSP